MFKIGEVDSIISMLEVKLVLLEEELKNESERLNRLKTNIFLIKNGGVPILNEITIKRVEPIIIVLTSNRDEYITELQFPLT